MTNSDEPVKKSHRFMKNRLMKKSHKKCQTSEKKIHKLVKKRHKLVKKKPQKVKN